MTPVMPCFAWPGSGHRCPALSSSAIILPAERCCQGFGAPMGALLRLLCSPPKHLHLLSAQNEMGSVHRPHHLVGPWE